MIKEKMGGRSRVVAFSGEEHGIGEQGFSKEGKSTHSSRSDFESRSQKSSSQSGHSGQSGQSGDWLNK